MLTEVEKPSIGVLKIKTTQKKKSPRDCEEGLTQIFQ